MRNKKAKMIRKLAVHLSPLKESVLMVTNSGSHKYPVNSPRAMYQRMKKHVSR